jgi:PAS domain S-box-containing protein
MPLLNNSSSNLARRERWLQTLLGSLGEGVVATDEHGRVTLMNRQAEALTGWTQEDAAGRSITEVLDLLDDADERATEAQILTLLSNGPDAAIATIAALDVTLVARNGTTTPVALTAAPIVIDPDEEEADGSVLGVVLVLRDVSARKQAEQHSARLAGDVRRLLESTGEGIYGVDRDGRCTFINRAGARLIGWEADELIGQNMHAVMHHSRPDGSPYPVEECPILHALRAGTEARLENELLWRRDGSRFWAQYSSYPVLENGRIEGAVITVENVSERLKPSSGLKKAKSGSARSLRRPRRSSGTRRPRANFRRRSRNGVRSPVNRSTNCGAGAGSTPFTRRPDPHCRGLGRGRGRAPIVRGGTPTAAARRHVSVHGRPGRAHP